MRMRLMFFQSYPSYIQCNNNSLLRKRTLFLSPRWLIEVSISYQCHKSLLVLLSCLIQGWEENVANDHGSDM